MRKKGTLLYTFAASYLSFYMFMDFSFLLPMFLIV